MMELLRKEMERVGLNNSHYKSSDDEIESRMEDGQEEESNTKKKNGKKTKIIGQRITTTLRTPADVFEYTCHYSYILDMPGLDASNIKVKVENGILHVSGKKKKKKNNSKQTGETTTTTNESRNEIVKVIRAERRRARYMRKFTLPENANNEDVRATYKDGVLSITISKRPLSLKQSMPNFPVTTIPIPD